MKTYKELVGGLSMLPSITVAGKEITGTYLAMIVAMNPELLTQEACDTPQLICELGRWAAKAHREKQRAEADYRSWRDGMVHSLTNDLDYAREAKFACVCSPGVDAKGNPKPIKLPAVTAAETYMRTLTTYTEHQDLVQQKEEAWATLYSALEAAKQRTWVIKTLNFGASQEAEDTQLDALGGAFGDNNFSGDFSGERRIVRSEGKSPPPPPNLRRS